MKHTSLDCFIRPVVTLKQYTEIFGAMNKWLKIKIHKTEARRSTNTKRHHRQETAKCKQKPRLFQIISIHNTYHMRVRNESKHENNTKQHTMVKPHPAAQHTQK